MEKQYIIRGAAILCMAASATVFAAPHIISKKSAEEKSVDLTVLQQRAPVKSAGLAGSGNPFAEEPASEITEEAVNEALIAPAGSAEGAAEISDAEMMQLAALDGRPAPLPLITDRLSIDERVARADGQLVTSGCEATLTASSSFDALIEVALEAPCHADSRFIMSHDDLVISAYLDSEGRYSTYLPALATTAKIDVFLEDDTYISAQTEVAEADQFLRVALQWTGEAQFSLHAYHDGAGFGDAGHVHASKPFDPNLDEAFLISLGEFRGPEPMLAQVYSLPASMRDKARLEVEVQFNDRLCGEDLMAFLTQSFGVGESEMTELIFAAPDCPTGDGMTVMEISLAQGHTAALPQDGLRLSGWED